MIPAEEPVYEAPPAAADGFAVHVSALKQAPPPSRKIISLSDALFALTPNPVVDPSRQIAALNGYAIQHSAQKYLDPANYVRVTLLPERQ